MRISNFAVREKDLGALGDDELNESTTWHISNTINAIWVALLGVSC